MLLPDKVGILHCAQEHRACGPGTWLFGLGGCPEQVRIGHGMLVSHFER